MVGDRICHFRQLRVFQAAMEGAMRIFFITNHFPVQEKFAIVNQIRRSSRSVCTNIAEAWRKRRYRAAFIAKLNDAESEACETQVWLEFAERCNYIDSATRIELEDIYDHIISQIIKMIEHPEKWLIPATAQ